METCSISPITEEKHHVYIELLKENLAHARHIEMERLTFMSLFLVSIGIIAEYSQERGLVLSLILGLCTFAANVICTALLRRWDSVYTGHMDIARKIAKALDTDDFSALEGNLGIDKPYYVNNIYNFNNRLQKKAAKRPLKLPSTPLYITTAQYFFIFNGVTYVMIIAFLVNTLLTIYSTVDTLLICMGCSGVILLFAACWKLINALGARRD